MQKVRMGIFCIVSKKTVLVVLLCCTYCDVLRIRVGCSTTRIPHRIVRPIVLTTAVTTPRTMPLCGPGCSGRSAPWVKEVTFYQGKSLASLQGQSVYDTFQI